MDCMQGTYEFMSDELQATLWSPHDYLHSPVDDLFSFYYTTQWAVAFNDGASGRRYQGRVIEEFREMITGELRSLATNVIRDQTREMEEYGPFFNQSLALLSPWITKLFGLQRDWVSVMVEAKGLKGVERGEYLGQKFLIYGYRGVEEYFKLLHEHRATLQKPLVL